MKKVQNSPKENFQETNQNSWVGQCDNRNKDCNDMVRKKKLKISQKVKQRNGEGRYKIKYRKTG